METFWQWMVLPWFCLTFVGAEITQSVMLGPYSSWRSVARLCASRAGKHDLHFWVQQDGQNSVYASPTAIGGGGIWPEAGIILHAPPIPEPEKTGQTTEIIGGVAQSYKARADACRE